MSTSGTSTLTYSGSAAPSGTGVRGGIGGATVASQFVVVAIVTCGVFAAVVITIMYRRRRAPHPGVDEWAWGGSGTHLLVDNATGMIIAQPRKKKRKVGPEPEIWDAVIDLSGGDGTDEDDVGSQDGDFEKEKVVDEKPGVNGDVAALWSPLAVALPSNPDPFRPSADVTLLIAMPEPPREMEEGEFPTLQLGIYSQHVAADWAELQALCPPKPKQEEREEVEPQRIRVDGFRRFRRAYA